MAGPDRYVAVGGTQAWTSTDGLSWRRVGLPLSAEEQAAFDEDHFVEADTVAYDWLGYLVGGTRSWGEAESAVIWTSADGLDWHRVPDFSDSADSWISGFGRLGDRLFAVGIASRAENGRLAVWTSTNGDSWEPVAGLQAILLDYPFEDHGVTTFGGQLVVWNGSWLLISRDGREWERQLLRAASDPPMAGLVSDILADGDRLVAVGARGCTSQELRAHGTGMCGYGAVWTSTDGRSWRSAVINEQKTALDGWDLTQVVRGHESFVTIGIGPPTLVDEEWVPRSWESTDGRAWKRSTTAPSRCAALAAGPAGVLCLGEEAWILR